MTFGLILLFTFIGSVASLAGSFFLLLRREMTEWFANTLLNFAAGVLLAVAFLDLLPEAVEEAGEADIFIPALGGFVAFFFAERFIHFFHHHHEHDGRPSTVFILVGDGIHNFIDGVAITAAFLTDTSLGIGTSLAVAAHEIPQEIADMGVLLANGLSRWKAVFLNFLSALAAIAGASIAYLFAGFVEENIHIFLSMAAGFFIYISASDLIPVLHERFREDRKLLQSSYFVLGLVSVLPTVLASHARGRWFETSRAHPKPFGRAKKIWPLEVERALGNPGLVPHRHRP